MDNKNYNKKILFGSLSWIVVGLYIVLNIGVFVSNIPLSAMIVVLPLLNILLICAWFFIRFFYNIANDPIKHNRYLSTKQPEFPIQKYGRGNGSAYVPNLKISTELFNSINTMPGNKAIFDISMKDYLKPKQVILFHDEMDYGVIKKVEVSKITILHKSIEASFSTPAN